MTITRSLIPFLAVTSAAALLLTACGREQQAPAVDAAASAAAPAAAGSGARAGAEGAGAAAPPASAASAPPVSVTTVRAQQRDVPVLATATGAVVPLNSVDVRAQVSSVITQVHIREGQFVRKGEPLFTLDSRTDVANVAKAQAQLARDEASLADAKRQLTRSLELQAQNFVSQGAVDANRTLVDAQTAAVAADRAAVDAARVALSYARVTAPGPGRAGAINVFVGSAVQANQTPLVTLTQLDPIAVAFSLPQRLLPDALAGLKDGGTAVTASLPDGSARIEGRLQFVDNAVDPATGTVKVKAQFPNANSRLWPGAFVNVELTLRTLKDAVVIPQGTIIQSPRGPIVYAVREGAAVPRPVQVLYAQGQEAAVSGVRAGERIVLDGRQNLRPGSGVVERPREGGRPGGAASGAATGGGASTGAAAGGASGAASGGGRSRDAGAAASSPPGAKAERP
jgi:RND family efflux transporter MFP subunit